MEYIKGLCKNMDGTNHCNRFKWNREGVECPCVLEQFKDVKEGEVFHYDPDNN